MPLLLLLPGCKMPVSRPPGSNPNLLWDNQSHCFHLSTMNLPLPLPLHLPSINPHNSHHCTMKKRRGGKKTGFRKKIAGTENWRKQPVMSPNPTLNISHASGF